MKTKKNHRRCSTKGCTDKYYAKGLCTRHYKQARYQRPEVKAAAKARYQRPEVKAAAKARRRTFDGLIKDLYAHMKSRTTCSPSMTEKNRRLYVGRFLPTQEDFIDLCKDSLEFHRLYKKWVLGGYESNLRPSPDRNFTDVYPNCPNYFPKNFTGGYELYNITFRTWEMNREMARDKRQLNARKAVNKLLNITSMVPGRTSVTKILRKGQKAALQALADTTNKRKNGKKAA